MYEESIEGRKRPGARQHDPNSVPYYVVYCVLYMYIQYVYTLGNGVNDPEAVRTYRYCVY
jgi:hypothetical protein